MNAPAELKRQHLIDPEICIRCNTCEEMCPVDAVTHDSRNYVVKVELCNFCNDCISPCPTGAIDNWRRVAQPFSLDEQFSWDSLPPDSSPEIASAGDVPEEVQRITDIATQGQGGPAAPPWSAAHPYLNLYTLARPAMATFPRKCSASPTSRHRARAGRPPRPGRRRTPTSTCTRWRDRRWRP